MRFLWFTFIFMLIGCAHKPERKLASTYQIHSEHGEENPRPQKWPVVMWQRIINASDTGLYTLTNALFDSIEEFDSNLYEKSRFKAGVRVKREVFDNQDILNSFTVVDNFRLKVSTQNVNVPIPLSISGMTLGFRLGSGIDIDWMNIRQVTASAYIQMPTIEEENSDLINIGLLSNTAVTDEPEPTAHDIFLGQDDGEVREVTSYESGSYFLDPSFRPRISKLFNMVTFPWKVPLTLKKLQKLEANELISYSFSGFIELGASVGFEFFPGQSEMMSSSSMLNVRTFVKGTFRITVLKENDRFVRVKLTRINENGVAMSLGGDAARLEVFEGFVLFKGTKLEQTEVLKQHISVIPFKLNLQKKWARSFDLGFRYDLQHEEGRIAYKKAVFGNFKYSSEFENRVNKSGDMPIARIFERTAKTQNTITDQRLKVFILYQNNRTRNMQSTQAVIELPDGKREVFKESSELDKSWKYIWGTYEKMKFNFTVSFDKTSFLQGKRNTIQLIAEGNIEDSHTSGKEMRKYINMVRSAVGKDEILPDLPVYIPKSDFTIADEFEADEDIEATKSGYKLARYRRSNFYFGYNIHQDHLEKFVYTPEEEMWPILEKAFLIKKGTWSTAWSRTWYRTKNIWATIANLPLFLVNGNIKQGSDLEAAKRFIRYWKKLKQEFALDSNGEFVVDDSIDEKISLFAELFRNRNYGYQYLRTLFYSLQNEEIDYFVTATNDSFGRIQERGRVITNPEYLLNLTDENIGFERTAGGRVANPGFHVTQLRAEVEDSKDRIKVKFNSSEKPNIVYIKIFKSNRLQKYKTVSEIVYRNKTRFNEGENEFNIDKKSLDQLSHILGENLKEGNFYTINISISQDAKSWSQTVGDRFYFEDYDK